MKNISILFGLTVLLFFAACKDKTVAEEIKVLPPQEFHDAVVNKDVQLLDVRTPEEFAEGHLKDAENINVLEDDFISEVEKLDPEKPIYVYCRSGKRSAKAAQILKEKGFKEIRDLQGGFLEWEAQGLPKEH